MEEEQLRRLQSLLPLLVAERIRRRMNRHGLFLVPHGDIWEAISDQVDIRNSGTSDYGEYILVGATLPNNVASNYEGYIRAIATFPNSGPSIYGSFLNSGTSDMGASAIFPNSDTSIYGSFPNSGTSDYGSYGRYMHASETFPNNGTSDMRASATFPNSGTSIYESFPNSGTSVYGSYGGYMPETATLPYNGESMRKVYIDGDHLVDIPHPIINEGLKEVMTINTAEYTGTCFPPKNVSTLGPIRQSVLSSLKAAGISVPVYFLSRCQQLKFWEGLKADSTKNTEEHRTAGNREFGFLLPSCPEEVKLFAHYLGDSVHGIPSPYYEALLILCSSSIGSQLKTTTSPFQNFQMEKTTNEPPQPLLLTYGQAIETFFPEITHITKFLMCITLTAVLIFRLHPGVQIILFMFLMVPALFFFLFELAHNASKTGVSVSCGSNKLPLFWFTTSGAVGIFLVYGLATLTMVYINWKLSKGKPRGGNVDDELTVEGLNEALQG